MDLWQNWVQRPQSLGFRKFIFQVHLWIGIGIGLYVLLISVSGSAIVFRRELMRRYARPAPIIAISGTRMSEDQLKEVAEHRYPGTIVTNIQFSLKNRPVTIVLTRGHRRMPRLFNPYTGEDLGHPQALMERVVLSLVDFHDNLLAADTGRLVNGAASILVLLLALSGLVVWWPGIRRWRRSVGLSWERGFVRFNWDLHSVLGFWCFLFVLMWGVSGVYLSFPSFFADHLSDHATELLARYHFGRMNLYTKWTWTILGLAPAFLFITGVFMWWSRVLVPFLSTKRVAKKEAATKEAATIVNA